jgi:hypothetical protein
MTTKSKPAIRALKLHNCNQADKIAYLIDSTTKLSIIITGDGDPAKGINDRVTVIHERQQGVLKTLGDIAPKIDGLLNEITAVRGSLATFKAEVVAEGQSKDKNFSKTTKIIMIVIAALGCLFAYQRLDKGQTDIKGQATIIETKVENQGIPFVTNSRGQILALPDSTKIMFWPNDSAKYIIKKAK